MSKPNVWIAALILLFAFNSVHAYLDCAPPSCPSGHTDNGIVCEGSTCERHCVIDICTQEWTSVFSNTFGFDDDRNEDKDKSSGYAPSDTSKCYNFTYSGPALETRVDMDVVSPASGDCDSEAIGGFWDDSFRSAPWFSTMNNHIGNVGDNEHNYLLRVMRAHSQASDDADYRRAVQATGSITCAPNSQACLTMGGGATCDTDCYGRTTVANVHQGYYIDPTPSVDTTGDNNNNLYNDQECGDNAGGSTDYVSDNEIRDSVYTVYESPTVQQSNNQVCDRTHEQPIAVGVTVLPQQPTAGQDLICNFTYSDPENFTEQGSIFEWWKNGINQNIDAERLGKHNLTPGNQWYCKVTPSDGLLFGSQVQSNTVTVRDAPQNPSFDVENHQAWNETGYFDSEVVLDFNEELTAAVEACVADEDGFCNISLTFSSDNPGVLNLSSIKIYYSQRALSLEAPIMTILSPLNNTLHTTTSIDLNWSSNKELDWCAYSLDGADNNTDICIETRYQESYNNSDGDTGNTNFHTTGADGDWSTESTPTNTNLAAAWVLYDKPTNTKGADWKIGLTEGNVTLPVPTDCVERDSQVRLRMQHKDDGDGTGWSQFHCYNDSGNAKFLYATSDDTNNFRIFEEAITWNVFQAKNTTLTVSEGIHNITIYGIDTIGNTGQSEYVYFEVNLTEPPAIRINLVDPLSEVNVTQHKLFNFTTEVCCVNNNCGEIDVSLDPEKKEYTPSTETLCTNGICNKIIYSGTRFVFEDNKWKTIENARSLKGIWNVIKNEDPDFPVEVIDFNYSSITLDLSLSDKKLEKEAELSVYNKYNKTKNPKGKDGTEKNKDLLVKSTGKDEKIREIIDLSDTEESILGQEIKWGDNSTTIVLEEPDTENVDDAYVRGPNFDDTNFGSIGILLVDKNSSQYPTGYQNAFVKFNISSLRSSVIHTADFYLRPNVNPSFDPGDELNHYVFHVYSNFSWNETNITWNLQPLAPAEYNPVWEDSESYDDQTELSWHNWSVVRMLQNEVDLGSDTLSIRLQGEALAGSPPSIAYRGKELAGSRPYLNITYTEILEKGLVSTIEGAVPFYTISENPTSITLNQSQCQNVTWLVNATGNVGNTYEFFAFANKTVDPSISNRTSSFDITIQLEESINLTDQSKFFIKDAIGNTIAWFGDAGNIVIKGTLEQNSNFQKTINSSLIIRNNGEDVVIVENNGNMHIDGMLAENQGTVPTDYTTNDFRVVGDGELVININESGSMFLKGQLIENGNP